MRLALLRRSLPGVPGLTCRWRDWAPLPDAEGTLYLYWCSAPPGSELMASCTIPHFSPQSTARPQSSALTVLRSVGLLDVLSKYDCGGLGRKPCQEGAFVLSLRPGMRNAG